MCGCCPDSTWSATGLLWAGLGVCAVTSGSCSPSGKSAHPPVASSTLLGTNMTVDKCMLLYASKILSCEVKIEKREFSE